MLATHRVLVLWLWGLVPRLGLPAAFDQKSTLMQSRPFDPVRQHALAML